MSFWQPDEPRMSAAEYRATLRALDLTIEAAAQCFGWSKRQASRYSSGRTPIPAPNRKLLRLAHGLRIEPRRIGGL